MNDVRTMSVALMNLLFEEVPRLKQTVRSGCDGAVEAHEKLIATLMSARILAHEIAKVDAARADALAMLEIQLTQEILKLTQCANAAVAGR